MMTAMATTTTTTTAIRTTKGVNPMQATMPLLPMARVADPRLFTILQARRARKFGLNITCPGKIAHIFFDRLKNSPPHPDIIRTTNPKKMCAFSLGQAIQTKHVIFAMLIVPWHLLAASAIFLLNAKSYWTRSSKSCYLRSDQPQDTLSPATPRS